MKRIKPTRRQFLSALTASAAGGALIHELSPFPGAIARTNASPLGPETKSEYFFADDLTYLNTGTLGPCRRETVEASLKYWEHLESLPVMFYGKSGAEGLAERTRTIASRFLGCDLSEMLITTNTTNGMNAVAQGLRLKAGDRIALTDQEHGGGLHCWQYFAKYYGAVIDTIKIPRGENNADAILNTIKSVIKKRT